MRVLQDYQNLIFVAFFTVGVFTTAFMVTSFIYDMTW